ncbi:MAG: hypothetical protein ABH851_04865 [Methanobacteriota archaeon]
MNLYRLLYVNKLNPKLVNRERLIERLINAKEFNIAELNKIRSFRGMDALEDSKVLDVRTLTRKAFSAKDLETKLRSLMRIKGVGIILATEILAFQNPYKYAAISHRVWNTLVADFGFEGEEKDLKKDFGQKEYELYISRISHLADEYGMKPADAEFVLNYIYKK